MGSAVFTSVVAMSSCVSTLYSTSRLEAKSLGKADRRTERAFCEGSDDSGADMIGFDNIETVEDRSAVEATCSIASIKPSSPAGD